jgi:hypothetical protein
MRNEMFNNKSQIGSCDTQTICAKSKESSKFIATEMNRIPFISLPPITKYRPEGWSLHWKQR